MRMAASELARCGRPRQPDFLMTTMRILIPALLCGACSGGLGPVVPETAVERKMLGLLEKFDRWDDNGDGFLDEPELAMALQGSEHQPARVIDFYDANGDRRISLREAQTGYHRSEEAEQRIRERQAREGAAP
jgi:hypothetical protein